MADAGGSMTEPWHQETFGGGEPVFVWLHGWGQTGASMARLAQLFSAHGRHVIYDLPGFGQTAMLAEGAGTEDYADALAAKMASAGIGPAIIVGHSFGGRMAVQMAARHPDRVKACIIIAGAGLKRRRSLAFKLRAMALRTLGRLARLSDRLFGTRFRDAYVARFGSADYKNAGALRATFVRAVNENLVAEAKAGRAPTLLLYGSDDTETPPEIGRRYEHLIPIARFVEMPGFGHLDILSRGAYQCEAQIRAFLKDLADA
ncbi:MAG: alpha/beta hydrolase [Alphaproteobacteria bacterium]|nr:MAG: alpha/beta hydrolase [Alphaproteobacteria bacterium]